MEEFMKTSGQWSEVGGLKRAPLHTSVFRPAIALPVAVLLAVFLSSCRGSAEFFGFTGKPDGLNGWSHDYNATPQDTWEAFRLIVRDNGEITKEDTAAMQLDGMYSMTDYERGGGFRVWGKVYDKSSEGELRSRLVVRCWDQRAASDGERPRDASAFCDRVYAVLKAWRGEGPDNKPTVTTTSEAPVQADEAIGFFAATPAQAYEVCHAVVKEHGDVDQAEPEGGFIRGKKRNPLERETQDVRVHIYDRTEGDDIRVKVSVRVRGPGGQPMQDVARAYVELIHERLLKLLEAQE